MNYNCKIIKMILKDNIYGKEVCNGFVAFKHWQQELEFIYVKEGFLDIEVDGEKFTIHKTELLIISSGVLHTFLQSDSNSIIYVVRIFLDDIAVFSSIKKEMVEFYNKTMLLHTNNIIKNIIENIMFADFGIYNLCYASIKAAELTIHIMTDKELIKRERVATRVGESETIIKMQQYIEDSLHKKITLGMLAEHLGFSKSYCSKFVKTKTNLNFLDYVKTIRLREAEELLRTTDLSITEVAYSTGFSSIQSFNRIFKETKGMNPTGYRKNLRN